MDNFLSLNFNLVTCYFFKKKDKGRVRRYKFYSRYSPFDDYLLHRRSVQFHVYVVNFLYPVVR